MFFDLNLQGFIGEKNLRAAIKTLVFYGYDVIAITTEITDKHFNENKKPKSSKKGSKDEQSIPSPIVTNLYQDFNIKIYNRINILMNEVATAYKAVQSKIVKQYDIISFLPGNTLVLKHLTTVTDFDILAFNPSIDNPHLHFTRKLYKQFVQNGVYMELPYAPAIQDSSHLKNCISTGHLYHAVGKSQNIIMTSASTSESLLRSPYNVQCLGYLFGLSEEQVKCSISENCEMLLLKARTRRRGRSTMEVTIESETTR